MTDADRKKAQAERQRRAALRSSVIQELRQQYSDAPEEIQEKRDFQTERDSREELHRRVLGVWGSRPSLLQMSLCNLLCRKNYEESMMVRLSLPKRAKTGRKRGLMSMSTQLSGITHFGDITALTGGEVSCTHTHTFYTCCSVSSTRVHPSHGSKFLSSFLLQDGISRPQKKKKVMKKKTKRKGDEAARHEINSKNIWIHSISWQLAFFCAAFKKHR